MSLVIKSSTPKIVVAVVKGPKASLVPFYDVSLEESIPLNLLASTLGFKFTKIVMIVSY